MAKDKKITVGAINVTIHPHTPERYIQLFKSASRVKKPVKVHGDQFGLLAGARNLATNQEKTGPITGDVYKFTNIDFSNNWFNIETNNFASEEDLEEVSLPENLKPNSSRFSYIFFPKNHILIYEGYYDGKSLTPTNAVRFFENILNREDLAKEFGKVEITHEPEKNALEQALKMKYLERLKLTIRRPNPDDLAEVEKDVLARMNTLKVEEQELSYKSSGNSIEVDKQLELIARVSARNGEVFAKGKNTEKRPVEFSTKKHPLIETDYYDPDIETPFSVFARMAESMKNNIIRLLNR